MAKLNLNILTNHRANLAARIRKLAARAERLRAEAERIEGVIVPMRAEIEAIDRALEALTPFQNARLPENPSRRGIPNAALETAVVEALRARPGGMTRSELWEHVEQKGVPLPSERGFAIWLSRNRARLGFSYDGRRGKNDARWRLAPETEKERA